MMITSTTIFALAFMFALAGAAKDETALRRFITGWNLPNIPFVLDDPVAFFKSALDDLASQIGAEFKQITGFSFPGGDSIDVTDMPPQLASLLSDLAFVKYVEEDKTMSLSPTSKAVIIELEGEEIPYGIQLVRALNVSDEKISNRKICIVDSGYDYGHEDLPFDDAYVKGIPDILDNGPWNVDTLGHGTHVAGIVSELGNNGKGGMGVIRNGKAQLYIARVFGDGEDSTSKSEVLQAMWSCAQVGANIIQISIGGPSYLDSERDSFKALYESGILIVASAGNTGSPAYGYSAAFDSVLSVGAVDENKSLAYFSTFNNQVELAAPGVNVLSTIPGGYARFNGTSMAAPHVTGVAALLWSHFPEKTNKEIRAVLQATAEDLGPQPGRDVNYGFGLVRADLAYEFLHSGRRIPEVKLPMAVERPEPNGECRDIDLWVDADGEGCDVYEKDDWCSLFGTCCENKNGLTANLACCACGGGYYSGVKTVQGNSDTNNEDDGASAGAIAGGVIAGVVVLLLIAVSFYFYKRRPRPKQQVDENDIESTKQQKEMAVPDETETEPPSPDQKEDQVEQ